MKSWTGASFPIVILVSLSALTLWLRHAVELPDAPLVNAVRHDPDTIVTQFKATALDATGSPLYRLEADTLVHYPDDDSADLTLPRLYYSPADQSSIHMVANRARIVGGAGDAVEFEGNVRVEREALPDDPGWKAELPHLVAYPNDHRATTSSNFVFLQGASRLTGTGFTLDERARTVQFHAAVRGEFPPSVAD